MVSIETLDPIIAQQVLLYNLVSSLLIFMVSVASLLVCLSVIIRLPMEPTEEGVLEIPLLLFTCLIVIAISLPTIVRNMDWLQIWLAPQLYLLEYVKGLA